MSEAPSRSTLNLSSVLGVSLKQSGPILKIRCQACQVIFDSPQPTMGGVPIGDHTCPQCEHAYATDPEVFLPIMSQSFERCNFSRAASRNAEAMRSATTWHRDDPWRDVFDYKGVDLGPPTEREIAGSFTEAFVIKKDGSKEP